MIRLIGLFTLLAVTGCTNNPSGQELLQAIEFGDDEKGCARISGNLDIKAGMVASTTVNVLIVKEKGDDVPSC